MFNMHASRRGQKRHQRVAHAFIKNVLACAVEYQCGYESGNRRSEKNALK